MRKVSRVSRPPTARKRLTRAGALLALLALPLGACAVDRSATATANAGAVPESDYWKNHPIVLSETPTILKLFPGKGRMDRASEAQIKAFAQSFKSDGVGQIEALFPAGSSYERSLPEIQRVLASAGVSGMLSVGSYPPDTQDGVSPVKLSYRSLRAKVSNKCGEFPTDLASAGSLEGWQNRPYWNFGCAYQNALAEQVDNPRDFVAPRAETPPDTGMRLRPIQAVRAGASAAGN